MTRSTPAPRVEALEAVQRRPADDAEHDAVVACDSTTMLPQSPCPYCDYPGPHRVSLGTPPYHQPRLCGACRHWLWWLSRLRPGAQEGHQ
jgi:hypothetical protein